MHSIQYINTPEKLNSLCQQIAGSSWVAIDTEFLREKTYYPKFCLLQVATLDWVACVDPIVLPSLDKLFETLSNPSITKVLHACRQDMEIFYQLTGSLPGPIFDTQIAAPLLGMQENPGYAMLVSTLLNINLGKSQTRTDWSMRPLSEEQLQYAAEDVIYLGQIYQIICQKLQELGRADWLQEDFTQLMNPELYMMPDSKAWMRIKGKNKLTGKQLSILQALAEWREQTAKQLDRPRNWLVRDDTLIDLVRLQPETTQDFKKLRSINERTLNRYGNQLCQIINHAKQQSPVKLEDKLKIPKKSQQQEAIVDVLSAIVRIRADQNSLNPAILASRKDLEMLLFEYPDCVLLHGWRYSMAGKELQEFLVGRQTLGIKSGNIEFNSMSG
jgi:ribonuclease D